MVAINNSIEVYTIAEKGSNTLKSIELQIQILFQLQSTTTNTNAHCIWNTNTNTKYIIISITNTFTHAFIHQPACVKRWLIYGWSARVQH